VTFAAAVRVLLGIPLLVPLLEDRGFLSPSIAPKVFLLRLASLAALALLPWAAPRAGPGGPRFPSWVTLGGAAFLLSAAASSLAGVDPGRSLWDTPERMMGLYTLLCGAAWYAAAVHAVRGWGEWRPLLFTAVAAGAAAGLLGTVQAVVPGMLPEFPGARPTSTLGHGTFLGTTALATVFLAAILRAQASSRAEVVLARLGIGAGVAGVLVSQSRGALAGLAAGAAALALVRIVLAPRGGATRRKWIAGLAVSACAGAAVLALGLSDLAREAPAWRRMATINPSDPSFAPRRAAITAAFQAARDRPLLGWGPCNFAYAFDAHYPAGFSRFGSAESSFDHAHTVPLNVLAVQGFPGMAAWLLLHGVTLLWLWRAAERGWIDARTAAAAVGFLAARFVVDLTVFDDPSALVHRVLFLALVASVAAPPREPPLEEGAPPPPPRWRRPAAAAAGVLLAVVAWHGDLRPAAANRGVASAIAAVAAGDPGAVERVRRALEPPVAGGDALRTVFGWTVTLWLPSLRKGGRTGEAGILARGAFEELGRAGEAHPRDIHPPLYRAALLLRDPGLRADPAAAAAVEEELERVALHAARRPEVKIALSDLRAYRGDAAGALQAAASVVALDPTNGAGWLRMACLIDAGGDRAAAKRTLERGVARGAWFTTEDAARAREILGR